LTVSTTPCDEFGTVCNDAGVCENATTVVNGNPYICVCNSTDFGGGHCETLLCPSFNWCSQNGQCVLDYTQLPDMASKCDCNFGWMGSSCNVASCYPSCGINGDCSPDFATPTCICDQFYSGASCATTDIPCPGGEVECGGDEHGTCNRTTGGCSCNDTFWTGRGCLVKQLDCPGDSENCNGQGVCNVTLRSCTCNTGWNGSACDIAVCPNSCSGHGTCDDTYTTPQCICESYWTSSDCSVWSAESNEASSGSGTSQRVYAIIVGSSIGAAVVIIAFVVIGGLLFVILKNSWARTKFRNAIASAMNN